jgi:hypothetical protein
MDVIIPSTLLIICILAISWLILVDFLLPGYRSKIIGDSKLILELSIKTSIMTKVKIFFGLSLSKAIITYSDNTITVYSPNGEIINNIGNITILPDKSTYNRRGYIYANTYDDKCYILLANYTFLVIGDTWWQIESDNSVDISYYIEFTKKSEYTRKYRSKAYTTSDSDLRELIDDLLKVKHVSIFDTSSGSVVINDMTYINIIREASTIKNDSEYVHCYTIGNVTESIEFIRNLRSKLNE